MGAELGNGPGMSEATYLYCLLRGPRRPSLSGAPAGLPGLSPLRVLEVGDGLWLIAAGAPLPEYGADEIQRRSRTSPGSPTAPWPMRR
jgi:hypothetical protein